MNIKKIIREEVNDFDWVDDISHLSFDYLNDKAMEFNPPMKDVGHYDNVLDTLTELGFDTDGVDIDTLDEYEGITGLYMESGWVVWTGDYSPDDTYQEHIGSYANKPVTVINGWEIFPK